MLGPYRIPGRRAEPPSNRAIILRRFIGVIMFLPAIPVIIGLSIIWGIVGSLYGWVVYGNTSRYADGLDDGIAPISTALITAIWLFRWLLAVPEEQ
jgi:hypothetical protein